MDSGDSGLKIKRGVSSVLFNSMTSTNLNVSYSLFLLFTV